MQVENKQHFFNKKNKLIYDMALKNCHVEGLHGIVFAKNQQYLERMFVATKDQVLYENQCQGDNPEKWGKLSLAVHPHRIDIEIIVITGTIWNMEFAKVDPTDQKPIFQAYQWNSHILNQSKSGGFQKADKTSIKLINRRKMCPGDRLKMKSDELHTVFIPKGQTASWFIIQSEATGPYDGITYANHNLLEWNSQGLYQKATIQQIQEYLSIAGITLTETQPQIDRQPKIDIDNQETKLQVKE